MSFDISSIIGPGINESASVSEDTAAPTLTIPAPSNFSDPGFADQFGDPGDENAPASSNGKAKAAGDEDDFDSEFFGSLPQDEQTQPEQTQPEKPAPVRDENGRFAPKPMGDPAEAIDKTREEPKNDDEDDEFRDFIELAGDAAKPLIKKVRQYDALKKELDELRQLVQTIPQQQEAVKQYKQAVSSLIGDNEDLQRLYQDDKAHHKLITTANAYIAEAKKRGRTVSEQDALAKSFEHLHRDQISRRSVNMGRRRGAMTLPTSSRASLSASSIKDPDQAVAAEIRRFLA